ncbi:ParA family protein [Kitasatospora aureofaciens]|uniref:ParA family protein n=1 Tax=Kitasatospora aureofaciens TaxID=1894 RepID=UPI0033AF29E0
MAHRIAFGKNKGGTGNTTSVVRTAEALAKKGKRVGVVDMDPQGNASRRLGWVDDPEKLTVSEAIEEAADGVAAQVWQPIGWDAPYAGNITLMPARFELENRAREAGQTGAYRRLVKALRGADDHLDYVLFDCQPSFGHLTEMAVAAAHYAVGTTEPEYDSLEAVIRWRDFVKTSREDLGNPSIELVGVVVTSYDQRLSAHTGQLKNCRTIFGDQVWGVVPQRSLMINADEFALPLSEVADSSEMRAVYELLAQRLMKEIPA